MRAKGMTLADIKLRIYLHACLDVVVGLFADVGSAGGSFDARRKRWRKALVQRTGRRFAGGLFRPAEKLHSGLNLDSNFLVLSPRISVCSSYGNFVVFVYTFISIPSSEVSWFPRLHEATSKPRFFTRAIFMF